MKNATTGEIAGVRENKNPNHKFNFARSTYTQSNGKPRGNLTNYPGPHILLFNI
jgi:hypothetical protein